jgi:FkbM family methyltransferase
MLRLLDGGRPGLRETTLEDGSLIRVDLADYMGRPVFYFGDFDPKITWICRRVLQPGDGAIDLGANIGIVALQMARLVGASGRVHAFEPQPDLAQRLREDAARNGYRQLLVHDVALSDRDGSARFVVSESNCGGAGLRDEPAAGYRMIEVPVRRALPVVESLDGPRVRLMKLDVEGHEDVILTNLRPWLATAKPDVVIFEVGEAANFWELPRVVALVKSRYRIFAVPRCVFRMRLAPQQAHRPLSVRAHDFVAVHAEASVAFGALGIAASELR